METMSLEQNLRAVLFQANALAAPITDCAFPMTYERRRSIENS